MKKIEHKSNEQVATLSKSNEPKQLSKSNKEMSNIDILYKEYRRIDYAIKKLLKEIDNLDSIDKDYKQKKLIACINLSKSLESVIYNYKQLNNACKETIINSQNIRKENALKSVTRYVKSKKNNVTLDNLEEHFTRDQIDYFYNLGINVEEIVINNSKVKRKNKKCL